MTNRNSENRITRDVAIANGGTSSDPINLGDFYLCGLYTPSALTSTSLGFQASDDGITYSTMYDSTGTAISATVSTSRFVVLNPSTFAGVRFLKLTCSAEGAARTITAVGYR